MAKRRRKISAKTGKRLRKLRNRLIEAHDGKCPKCRVTLLAEGLGGEPNLATLDHILPQAQGGTHHQSNLRLLCALCNRLEADKSGLNTRPQKMAA